MPANQKMFLVRKFKDDPFLCFRSCLGQVHLFGLPLMSTEGLGKASDIGCIIQMELKGKVSNEKNISDNQLGYLLRTTLILLGPRVFFDVFSMTGLSLM